MPVSTHQLWDYTPMLPCLTFSHGLWGLNLGPQAYVASTSPIARSLQLCLSLIFKLFYLFIVHILLCVCLYVSMYSYLQRPEEDTDPLELPAVVSH